MSYMKQENLDFDMDPSQISSNLGDGSHGEYNHPAVQSAQNTITAFLAKLWALVNDATCDDLIAWDVSGASFHVYDQARFAREILPRYFKHNNFASFIRQLNMYGFRKISNIEHGSLKNERDDIEFAHPHFIRGQESMLELIKRRAPDSQQRSGAQGGANASSALAGVNYLDSKSGRSFEYAHLLDDVRNLQTKQTSLSDKLSYMQTENQALWNEIGSLRQKHSRQQQIVSKLMEFLLQFISNASAHHQDQSVHRQVSNEVLHTDASNPQNAPNQQQANNPPLVLSEQALSPNSLKRKYTALAHLDEPNKRAHTQQQQQQQQQEQGVRPPNLGRQQSVTINELTDQESSGWHHPSNASPVIDLVPSPPPSIHSADDNHHLQQSAGDYRWSPAALDQKQQPKSTFATVGNGNGNGAHTTFTPDFYLRPDGNNAQAANGGKPSPVAPAPLKEELLDLPQPNDLRTSPTLYSQNQQQHKIGQGGEQLSFSLDDITGDVDHIQCSLDNIRDLMFDNMPEGTSIDDFFGDEALLLPMLDPTSTTDQTPNLLLESIKDQKLMSNESQSNDGNGVANSQSVPNLNDALIAQLKTKTATVEEQKVAIDQLAHKNSLLEDRIHHLEQEKAQPK